MVTVYGVHEYDSAYDTSIYPITIGSVGLTADSCEFNTTCIFGSGIGLVAKSLILYHDGCGIVTFILAKSLRLGVIEVPLPGCLMESINERVTDSKSVEPETELSGGIDTLMALSEIDPCVRMMWFSPRSMIDDIIAASTIFLAGMPILKPKFAQLVLEYVACELMLNLQEACGNVLSTQVGCAVPPLISTTTLNLPCRYRESDRFGSRVRDRLEISGSPVARWCNSRLTLLTFGRFGLELFFRRGILKGLVCTVLLAPKLCG